MTSPWENVRERRRGPWTGVSPGREGPRENKRRKLREGRLGSQRDGRGLCGKDPRWGGVGGTGFQEAEVHVAKCCSRSIIHWMDL